MMPVPQTPSQNTVRDEETSASVAKWDNTTHFVKYLFQGAGIDDDVVDRRLLQKRLKELSPTRKQDSHWNPASNVDRDGNNEDTSVKTTNKIDNKEKDIMQHDRSPAKALKQNDASVSPQRWQLPSEMHVRNEVTFHEDELLDGGASQHPPKLNMLDSLMAPPSQYSMMEGPTTPGRRYTISSSSASPTPRSPSTRRPFRQDHSLSPNRQSPGLGPGTETPLDHLSQVLVDAGFPPLPTTFPHAPPLTPSQQQYLVEAAYNVCESMVRKDADVTRLLNKIQDSELREAQMQATLRQQEKEAKMSMSEEHAETMAMKVNDPDLYAEWRVGLYLSAFRTALLETKNLLMYSQNQISIIS